MKERGQAFDSCSFTENYIDFSYSGSCKKHPSSSSAGICAFCLKDRLVNLVCSECGEQRLSSCSCSDASSYRNSCTGDVGSVGRISFLIENEKTDHQPLQSKVKKGDKSEEVIVLRRSSSSCVEIKRSKSGFWKIKRLFIRKNREKGVGKDGFFDEKIDVKGVVRSRSLCSFRGGGLNMDADEGSDYAFSSAKISDVTGGILFDSDRPYGFSDVETRKSGFRGFSDAESEPRKSGFRGLLDPEIEPRRSGFRGLLDPESESRRSGFRGLTDAENEPRRSGFRGVLDAENEPRKSGFRGLSDAENEPRRSGFRGLSDAENESRKSGFRGLFDAENEPRRSGFKGLSDAENEPRRSGFRGLSDAETEPRKSGFRGLLDGHEIGVNFRGVKKSVGPLELNRVNSVPNRSVFPVKESDFSAMDESAFIDLKLDLSLESKREFSAARISAASDHDGSLRNELHESAVSVKKMKNRGGSCRITENEKEIKTDSKSHKVWKWIFRQNPGRKSLSKEKNENNILRS